MVNRHVLNLEAASGSLRFERNDEADWYEVFYCNGDAAVPIGAECLRYLVKRLTGFLAGPAMSMRWILSLAELNCSLYGTTRPGGGVVVLLQNAEAQTMATIEISPGEQQTWLRALQDWSRDFTGS